MIASDYDSTGVFAMSLTDAEIGHRLSAALSDQSPAADERWRRWSADLLRDDLLGPDELRTWWNTVVGFDDQLPRHADRPVEVPDGTVIVAGSGKETFKTFNVSTAAAILAAAAGTPVVKGVSASVSAVSGSADILNVLRISPVDCPTQIAGMVETYGIAFTPYSIFCPRYAARYDGVFDRLSPASFFMPVATLCVRATGYLHGLAHRDVALAAAALRQIRPDLRHGVVVCSEPEPGQIIDEFSDVGVARLARASETGICRQTRAGTPAKAPWRQAVAHRGNHTGNALMVTAALTPGPDTPASRLVEANAALAVTANGRGVDPVTALDQVREARQSGLAHRLLTTLTHLG